MERLQRDGQHADEVRGSICSCVQRVKRGRETDEAVRPQRDSAGEKKHRRSHRAVLPQERGGRRLQVVSRAQ